MLISERSVALALDHAPAHALGALAAAVAQSPAAVVVALALAAVIDYIKISITRIFSVEHKLLLIYSQH
jgi:stage V sporulation protein SpoVS